MKTALKKLAQADYIFQKTYPAMHDPKLLLVVIENALQSMDAHYIELFSNQSIVLDADLNTRMEFYAKQRNIPKHIWKAMLEMHTVLKNHKTSPVEFRRKKQFIICSNEYHLDEIDEQKVKNYINMAKELQVNT